MISIDQTQFDQVATAMDAEFARQAVPFFRQTLATDVSGRTDGELQATTIVGLHRCRSYGVCKTPAILQFVSIMLLVSPVFDTEPDVARFLHAPGVTLDLKIEVLTQLLARHFQRGT